MKKSASGIYMILNLFTNQCYVGSTTRPLGRRWSEHKSMLRKGNHGNPPLQEDWNQYGESAFRFVVLENASENLFEREQYWLDNFREKGISLHNRCPNAESHKGLKMPEEIMKQIHQKALQTKRNWTEERKQEYSNKLKASWTIERRQKFSQAMREARFKKMPVYHLRSPNGQSIEIRGLKNFCIEHNLNLSAMIKVITGKRPSHKGWKKYHKLS